MNIINFTPIESFTGGVFIGLAVAVLFLLRGNFAGISARILEKYPKKDLSMINSEDLKFWVSPVDSYSINCISSTVEILSDSGKDSNRKSLKIMIL